MRISMTMNGREVSGEVEGRTLLVHFIREQALLTGPTWAASPGIAVPAR